MSVACIMIILAICMHTVRKSYESDVEIDTLVLALTR